MSNTDSPPNRVRELRRTRGWSQAELAEKAGISRTAVSAVEGARLVPSVAAAIALAQALETTVETLFAAAAETPPVAQWAWPANPADGRYWEAAVAGRLWRYPAEPTSLGELVHDGRIAPAEHHAPPRSASPGPSPHETLVMAGCDPAASLLATEYARRGKFRLLPLVRSSRAALRLLAEGKVHVAGVHLGQSSPGGNQEVVRHELGPGYRLLRLTDWEQGVAVGSRENASTLRSLVKSRVRWVAREQGSGARQCLDELLGEVRNLRRVAADHRGVAAAIRSGWGDAGVCLRLVSEEAALRFLPLHWEGYDLCYPVALEQDPRLLALTELVRTLAWRELIADVPGYDSRHAGELATVN